MDTLMPSRQALQPHTGFCEFRSLPSNFDERSDMFSEATKGFSADLEDKENYPPREALCKQTGPKSLQRKNSLVAAASIINRSLGSTDYFRPPPSVSQALMFKHPSTPLTDRNYCFSYRSPRLSDTRFTCSSSKVRLRRITPDRMRQPPRVKMVLIYVF